MNCYRFGSKSVIDWYAFEEKGYDDGDAESGCR